MERTCARAVRLGLPSVAFTEHVDHTVWSAGDVGDLPADHPVAVHRDAAGLVRPPPFDAAGYLAAVERCRDRFPGLRILTGLELGEPHWHAGQVGRVLAAGRFDRVLGSLHCLPHGAGFQEPGDLYAHRDPGEVLRAYLLEIAELVGAGDAFAVLAHVDYPLRSWPGPFDPAPFEDEFRHALHATAQAGKVLEINTALAPRARILRWWREEGGSAVTFGSDAHEPAELARGFAAAAGLAEAAGFRPAADPLQPWPRA